MADHSFAKDGYRLQITRINGEVYVMCTAPRPQGDRQAVALLPLQVLSDAAAHDPDEELVQLLGQK